MLPLNWLEASRAGSVKNHNLRVADGRWYGRSLRFFSEPEDLIQLPDASLAVVNNQWGENIDFFIAKATETFGIEITREN